MEKEIWENIEGFENYKISNSGNVKSLERIKKLPTGGKQVLPEIILKPKLIKGYRCVKLCKDGKHFNKRICRLVGFVYCVNPQSKLFINHKDANKANDYYENLEWVTDKENAQHAVKMGLHFSPACKGEKNGNSKLTNTDIFEIRKHKEKGLSNRSIAKRYSVSNVLIGLIINGKNWRHIK